LSESAEEYLVDLAANSSVSLLSMTSNLDFLHGLCDSNSAALKEAIGIDQEQRFVEFAAATYLAPLYHELLKNENLESVPILASLENARNQVLVRNMRLYKVFEWFLVEMNKREIPMIPLKGIYAAEKLYGDIGLRHLSDIDVLVKEQNTEEVVHLMEANGWQVKKAISHSGFSEQTFKKKHPYSFSLNGVIMELHTHLYDTKYGAQVTANEIWSRTHTKAFLNGTIHQFDPQFLLQHWCNHLFKHLSVENVKMLSFWDIRLLTEQEPAFDWQKFHQLCTQYNCQKQCFSILWLSAKYWGVSVPEACQAQNSELEARFLHFLNAEIKSSSESAELRLSSNLTRIRKLDEFSEKLRFLARYIFPKKAFMHQNYNVHPDNSVSILYVYRPIELSVKLILALWKKFTG
jgi:hypothetical protein